MERDSVKSFVSETQTPIERRIVYGVQVVGILLIIITCLLNLSIPNLHNDKLEKLWVGLLFSSIGYLLPNPSLKKRLTLQ